MSKKQQEIIAELGVKPAIDSANEIAERIDFLCEYLKSTGAKGYVLGISGGQDSSLAGRLAQLAVEKLRSEGHDATFVAARLPYRIQHDETDAQKALEFIQPDKIVTFNIQNSTDGLVQDFAEAVGEQISDFNKGNVKARMRMVSQYALGAHFNLLVIGTDHAAEAVTGFFTKFGDGGADVLPLSGLSKGQGKELLKVLGANPKIWMKVPTADLLDGTPGQADEDNLGLSYELIDEFLVGKTVGAAQAAKIIDKYQKTAHKRALPVTPFDEWWHRK